MIISIIGIILTLIINEYECNEEIENDIYIDVTLIIIHITSMIMNIMIIYRYKSLFTYLKSRNKIRKKVKLIETARFYYMLIEMLINMLHPNYLLKYKRIYFYNTEI